MAEPDERERLKAVIAVAFASVERPGNWALRGSNEGDEPYLLERDFGDKQDWRTLEPVFLDRAPDGYASALSFFSDEAFRYFLPAYLIADLDEALDRVDAAFHLWHGLDDGERDTPVNPRRFGARTWFDAATHRLSVFTRQEAAAIVAYLRYKAAHAEFDRERRAIEQAIRNYWAARAGSHA